jgi:hypothetical protein
MARILEEPDSATSQWFVNLGDNSILDSFDGGFSVFGEVVDGMDVVDAIAALTKVDASSLHPALEEVPAIGVSGGITIEEFVAALVVVNSAQVIPEPSSALLLGGGLLVLALRRHAR